METYDHDTYSTPTAKEIPISMLTQLLSERVGHRVEVGNIRTTLFDMFGKDASPTFKCFVKLALEQLKVMNFLSVLENAVHPQHFLNQKMIDEFIGWEGAVRLLW